MTTSLLFSLLAATLFAPPSAGSSRGADAPVGIRFADSIPTHERASLEATFAKTLPLACAQVPCTHDCSADQPTLGLELRGDSRDYALHWVANDPRLPAPIVLESRCELCSLVELEDQFAAELSRLCSRLEVLDAGAGRLMLRSEPGGARVFIDGKAVGRTPWSGELPAGEHRVEIRAAGYRSDQRTVRIHSNVDEDQSVVLLAKRSSQRARPSWPGWTSLGLGVAMSIAGTALIAVHGQQYTQRCTGPDIDVEGNCRFLLATRPLGIGLAAAGAAAIAGGVGLVIWAQRDATQSSAGLAFRGRF
jgi:hypothetical protein